MRQLAALSAALLAVFALIQPAAAQDAPATDFKAGENTWASTKVGESVEYELKAGLRVRYLLKAIGEDGVLTVQIKNFGADGKELSTREVRTTPDKAPVQSRQIAEGATWSQQEYVIGKKTLTCDVMTWDTPQGQGEVWFSSEIPCGGVVRVRAAGADNVWVRAFTTNGATHALPNWPAMRADDFSTRWTTWHTTQPGDWAVYQFSDGGRVRYRLVSRDADMLTIEHIVRDANGNTVLEQTRQYEVTDAIHMGRQPDPFAFFEATEWKRENVAFAGRNLPCQIGRWLTGGSVERVWFSKEVPCGGVVRDQVDNTAPTVLVGFRTPKGTFGEDLDGEAKPEPEPTPMPTQGGYGDPITMALPENVRKQMRDQGTAITRMRLYFQEGTNVEDGATLEFEGMHTEVPVIYAAFVPERCDKVLSYADWAARGGHYIDLGFEVKTRPKVLKGMTVQIEHSHMQGDAETVLSTWDVANPAEPGEPWEGQRLRGAKPGINRYALVITYINAKDETTTQRGFSHWVVINSPPMFEFTNDATAVATRTQAGSLTLLDADVRMSASFLLHHGLKPEDCTLRVSRRGKREINLDALPPDVRRAVAKDEAPPGWQELGRCGLAGGMIQGRKAVTVEDSFVKITFSHGFAAGSNVLPATEEWEYSFELHHKDSAKPLATWNNSITLKVAKPADIEKAQLRVDIANKPEPLLVPFQKK